MKPQVSPAQTLQILSWSLQQQKDLIEKKKNNNWIFVTHKELMVTISYRGQFYHQNSVC